jgi:hypothetical protein
VVLPKKAIKRMMMMTLLMSSNHSALTKLKSKAKTELNEKMTKMESPGLVLVEFTDKLSQSKALSSAKKLKKISAYSKVYVNRDLTLNEMEAKRLLRKERNLRNSKLDQEEANTDGGRPLKFGREGAKMYYWGIRFGILHKIDKETKKILRI